MSNPLCFDTHASGTAGNDANSLINIVRTEIGHLRFCYFLELTPSDLANLLPMGFATTFLDTGCAL
jgi:hypothetical protein